MNARSNAFIASEISFFPHRAMPCERQPVKEGRMLTDYVESTNVKVIIVPGENISP
jgi:hypothetical protein